MSRRLLLGLMVLTSLTSLSVACGGGDEPEPLPPPATPSGLSGEITWDAVAGRAEVLLTWTDNATNESGYRVERSGGGGPFAPIGVELAPNSVTWVDGTCVAGTTYAYRVAALGPGGSATSPPATVPYLPAAAPVIGAAVAASSSTIGVTWSNSAPDALSFKVYRSEDDTAFVEVASIDDPAATSFDDGGLQPLTQYYYRVTATNLIGESAQSASASATTPAAPPVVPDAAPTGLAAGTPTASTVPLTWACAATNEAGFKIYWNTVNSKPATPSATLNVVDATGTTATGLTGSTTYYFWVTAFNAVGESGVAGPVTATTAQAIPAAPTGFTAATYIPPKTTTPTGVRFTWVDASSNETGFRIYSRAYSLGCKGTAEWILGAEVGANVQSWIEPFGTRPPPSGTQLCFRVGAYNGSGTSYSGTASWTMP